MLCTAGHLDDVLDLTSIMIFGYCLGCRAIEPGFAGDTGAIEVIFD